MDLDARNAVMAFLINFAYPPPRGEEVEETVATSSLCRPKGLRDKKFYGNRSKEQDGGGLM